jgi:hypothetical protein
VDAIIVHEIRSHWPILIGLLSQNPLVFILYDVDHPASSCRFASAIHQVSFQFQQWPLLSRFLLPISMPCLTCDFVSRLSFKVIFQSQYQAQSLRP